MKTGKRPRSATKSPPKESANKRSAKAQAKGAKAEAAPVVAAPVAKETSAEAPKRRQWKENINDTHQQPRRRPRYNDNTNRCEYFSRQYQQRPL